MSIALRKGQGGHRRVLVNNLLTDPESMKKLLEFDDGYRFSDLLEVLSLFGKEPSVT